MVKVRKFNADRPPLIIIAVIPFAMIGITFGFIALLGTMSLFGMMIKNSVVLLDQVNLNIARGMKPYDAVISAGLNRLAPVVNAIIARCFWVSLAVIIMFGLTVGTIVAMFLVPVLFCILYRISSKENHKN